MNSKFYILAVACLIGGLAGGYLLGANASQSQLAAYEAQIQNTNSALDASEAQILVKDAEIQAKEALIQALQAQVQAQESLLQANAAQIEAQGVQISQLTILSENQADMIQLLQAALTLP